MPGIVVFNRRWSVGSDDLVIPATVLAIIHTVWIIVLAVVLGLDTEDNQSSTGCGFGLRVRVIGFLATLCVSMALELTAAGVSMRGTILNAQPRVAMPYLLYLRLGVLVMELVWQVLGVVWAAQHYNTCGSLNAKRALIGIIVCNGIVTLCVLLSIWCTFDTAGRSWVKMKRYQESQKGREPRAHQKRCSGSSRRNWRHRKAMRKYEQSWDRRCRFLFCCVKEDRHRNSFTEIAKLFTEFFRDLDVVPSDVVAGLVLLRKHQQLHRKFVVSQCTNDVYEFLSGVPITPSTSFVDVSCPEVLSEYQLIVHYMRYSLAAYGWPIYIMMNTGTGLCKIMPKLRCCCCCYSCCNTKKSWRALLVDDNCCHCNFAALQQLTGLRHLDIVYATYHVDIGETPFYIAIDHEQKTIVISIRGTLSLQDVLTDLKADAEILPVEPMKEDWLAHKGMVQAAAYIRKKIKDEMLLTAAFDRDPERGTRNYDVVVVGHSLGAGTATILAILMRQEYPRLQCYAYSPPGGLLSAKCVDETKSFITSVVVGKDVVPRIGLHQLEAFRQDLINVIKKSSEPKWKIIAGSVVCCCCRGDEDEALTATQTVETSELMRQEKETRSFIHPGDAQISLSTHTPLFLPGKILHVVRNHPPKTRSLCCGQEEPVYEAVWADKADFDEVLISPTMVNDHMPDKVLEALEKVLSDVGSVPSRRHSPGVVTVDDQYQQHQRGPVPCCVVDVDKIQLDADVATRSSTCLSTPDNIDEPSVHQPHKPNELSLIDNESARWQQSTDKLISCSSPPSSSSGPVDGSVCSPSGCYIESRYPHLKARLEQLPVAAADVTVYRYSVEPPSPVGYADETPSPEVTPIPATDPSGAEESRFVWNNLPTDTEDQSRADVETGQSSVESHVPTSSGSSTGEPVVNSPGPEQRVTSGDVTTAPVDSVTMVTTNVSSTGIGGDEQTVNGCVDVGGAFGNDVTASVNGRLGGQSDDDDCGQQYLYDAFYGHYSPAGRGYPHGLYECPLAVKHGHVSINTPHVPPPDGSYQNQNGNCSVEELVSVTTNHVPGAEE